MPEIAANSTDAAISSWNTPLGAPYSAGDAIVTIETDKAVVDVEAQADGVFFRFLVEEGHTAEVGAPIAVWGASSDEESGVEELLAALGEQATEPPAEAQEPDTNDDAPESTPPPPAAGTEINRPDASEAPTTRLFASPLARRIAREQGHDLTQIVGSGPGGRIRRRDLDQPAQNRDAQNRDDQNRDDQDRPSPKPTPKQPPEQAEATPEAKFHDVPVSRMRAAIGRRLTESKQTAPHFYVRASVRMDALIALRRELNSDDSLRVSVNSLLIKAVAAAHVREPALNVEWHGDSIRHFENVDVAIAVATDQGLVTPVLHNVEMTGMRELVAQSQRLIDGAKNRTLRPDQLTGGSITVTNLGMYGTEEFTAIINPPQASILAVGAIREAPVVDGGEIAVGQLLQVTLAVDHRPVDGASAATWMSAFTDLVERPLQILL